MNTMYAEYAVADERFVVPVPDAVSSRDAAPLTCARVTTFKAIKVAGVAPGERVGVFGIGGGLGHLADVFALHAAGRTRVVAETRKLDEINTIFADVLAGRVPARVVLEL